jgi:hypothetical protein
MACRVRKYAIPCSGYMQTDPDWESKKGAADGTRQPLEKLFPSVRN